MKALDKARRAEQVNADLAEPMRPTSTLGNISGGCQGREVESDFSCEISCLAARHAILPSEGTIASRAIPILAHPTPVPSRFPQRYTVVKYDLTQSTCLWTGRFTSSDPDPDGLSAQMAALGLTAEIEEGPAAIRAVLATPFRHLRLA